MRRVSVFVVLILLAIGATSAQNITWLEGYKYKVPILITELSGNDLTGYQVRINLNSSNFNFSHFLNSGNDLRFTDAKGNLLSYWVESMNITAENATNWVKVPSIPANGSVEIYMYYGSETAISASNAEGTFVFADDGEEGVICKYWPKEVTCVKPAIIEGKKYYVITDGLTTDPSNCSVVECDENWSGLASYEAPFTTGEIYVPRVGDSIPGKLIFLATNRGKLVLFDLETKNFDYVEGIDNYWINLEKIDDYYYLQPGLETYFYKFHKNDILNTANWTKVQTPTPEISKTEYRMCVFNDYLYILRFNQKDYPFSIDLIRYNPSTDTFETIIPETNDTTDIGALVFPYIYSDGERVVLSMPRSSPTPHFDIMLSTDGLNFTTIASENMVETDRGEMHCHIFVVNEKIYVLQANDDKVGQLSVYDLNGTLLARDRASLTAHNTENACWIDGENIVVGGEKVTKVYPCPLMFIPLDHTEMPYKWTYSAREGQVFGVSDGKQGNYSIHVFNGDSETTALASKNEMPTSCEASVWVKVNSTNTTNVFITLRAAENDMTWYEAAWTSGGTFKIGKHYGGYSVLASTSVDFVLDAWRKIVMRTVDSQITAEIYDENGNLLARLTATDTDIASGRAGFGGWDDVYALFDCFVVRNYTEPEPSVTLGDEHYGGNKIGKNITNLVGTNGWIDYGTAYPSEFLDMYITPVVDIIKAYDADYDASTNTWTVTVHSDISQAVSFNISTGLANQEFNIYRNGTLYATVTTTSDGWLNWTYDGGFSTWVFTFEPVTEEIWYHLWWNGTSELPANFSGTELYSYGEGDYYAIKVTEDLATKKKFSETSNNASLQVKVVVCGLEPSASYDVKGYWANGTLVFSKVVNSNATGCVCYYTTNFADERYTVIEKRTQANWFIVVTAIGGALVVGGLIIRRFRRWIRRG